MVPIELGSIIKIHNWYGVVLEKNFDEMGQLSIIRVQTPRNIFRNFGPEYIDVRLSPEAIMEATIEDLQEEIAKHQRLQQTALENLISNVKTKSPAVEEFA